VRRCVCAYVWVCMLRESMRTYVWVCMQAYVWVQCFWEPPNDANASFPVAQPDNWALSASKTNKLRAETSVCALMFCFGHLCVHCMCMCMCLDVYVLVCVCMCMFGCVCVWVYLGCVCVDACVHMCECVCKRMCDPSVWNPPNYANASFPVAQPDNWALSASKTNKLRAETSVCALMFCFGNLCVHMCVCVGAYVWVCQQARLISWDKRLCSDVLLWKFVRAYVWVCVRVYVWVCQQARLISWEDDTAIFGSTPHIAQHACWCLVYTHTHTHTHTITNTNTNTHTCIHSYTHTNTNTHTCTHKYIHIHTHKNTYTHMHTLTHTHTHAHTHVPLPGCASYESQCVPALGSSSAGCTMADKAWGVRGWCGAGRSGGTVSVIYDVVHLWCGADHTGGAVSLIYDVVHLWCGAGQLGGTVSVFQSRAGQNLI